MGENELRDLILRVKHGTLSRRRFVGIMVGLGLTAPMASQMLAGSGVAMAQAVPAYKPTKRGGGGALRLLWWQAPTLLNPHFAVGTKDFDGSRLFYEPLAAWDPEGNLVPILAAEIPSPQNGGVAPDGRSVTWKLKRNVSWHDGRPFTADDVVFNCEFASDPATAALTIGNYRAAKAEKIDTYTVRVVFAEPTPYWAIAYVGNFGMQIPKHLFDAYRGAKSRDAPTNLKPVGTGPYRFVDFRPGDTVRGEINPNYHEPNRPHFDTVEMKGGGDAVSAARAVLQTGEFDYAWNMQVEDEILKRLENGGKGRVVIAESGGCEHLQCNFTDPWTEVDGERSSAKTKHPILSDAAVREALNLLADRASIQEHVYGRGGTATRNFLASPARFCSPKSNWEFNVDKANQALETAGWKRGADGIRTKDGKRLRMLFQTAINAPRQKTQAIVKQAAARVGIDIELKSIVPAVYFSTDPANLDTSSHFTADLQMYSFNSGSPDPQRFMDPFVSWEASQKENKWAGRNSTRWRNEEYDRLFRTAETEMDPVKRAAHFIRMNDLLAQNVVIVPFLWRGNAFAVSNRLQGTEISGWDSNCWNIAHWYKTA